VRRSRRDFCALLFLVLNLLFSPVAVHAAALADFSLKLASLVHDKQKPDNDKLTAQGEFRLGVGATADPETEPVTLTLGSFSQTIPANSFTKKTTARRTTWTFKGVKGGPPKMTIVQTGEQWTFTASGVGLSLVLPTTEPNPSLTVSLRIGDDSGSLAKFFDLTTNTAKKTIVKFPPGKKDDADGDGFLAVGKNKDCEDQDPSLSWRGGTL